MKKTLPVTRTEVTFSPESRIASTTDLKGQITHINATFTEIPGFTEADTLACEQAQQSAYDAAQLAEMVHNMENMLQQFGN